MDTITFRSDIVKNKYSFLSNFYPDVKRDDLKTTASFTHDGNQFHNVEHYYMWAKMAHVDKEYADTVLLPLKHSLDVRSAGAKGAYIEWKFFKDSSEAGFTPTEHTSAGGWKVPKRTPIKKSVIKKTFEEKVVSFDRDEAMRTALKHKFENPILRQALIDTGYAKLEEVGGARGSKYWSNAGENKLGILLMELRDSLTKTDS